MKNPIDFLPTLDDEKVVKASTYGISSKSLTESQKKIVEVCDSMKDLLLYKNLLMYLETYQLHYR